MNTQHPNSRSHQMRRSSEAICASSLPPHQSLIEIESVEFDVLLIDPAKVSEPHRIMATMALDECGVLVACRSNPLR